MKAIIIGRETCASPEAAGKLEWLETNGLGGFSSSTILGMNTRRYHALLTAATRPPVGRVVMLSKFEEAVTIGDRRYDLSSNRYPGAMYPEGYRYLREFRLDPCPTFVFELDGVVVEKSVFMPHGENATVIEYRVGGEATLELRPLIAFRDYHATTHCNDVLDSHYAEETGLVSVCPYRDLPVLYLAHDAAAVSVGAGWYYHFEYDRERERGLDFQEDLFNPLTLTYRLSAGARATVIASTLRHAASDSGAMREREMARRAALVAAAPLDNPLAQRLALAADQFLVQRGELESVVAGYPWFSNWGRDTMISLPGLTLATGRFDAAKRILRAFAASMDQGMLPNRFPDAGEQPEYNTVDATLWFFEAIRAYGEASGDYDFIRQNLYPRMKESIDWHLRGTRYGIHVDDDGLLACGEPGVQLTWMDAKVADWVVTPRHGKPVEIQALWYNALCIAQEFADADYASMLRELGCKARSAFRALFWNAQAGCLYDVVNGDVRDSSIRPNQIFALSLPHRMLDEGSERQVLDLVERELLTPAGLRTLSRSDPQYRGRYEGGVVNRDSAYHQGTVWPWLIGPFLTAYTRLKGGTKAAEWLKQVPTLLESDCLGQFFEVADGDGPHLPGGCFAQAWSVAEICRLARAASPTECAAGAVGALPVDSALQPPASVARAQHRN
ncbi:MAG: amylo-alpha-1,6-glucosidase [Candidatus Solibacter sp.]